MNSASSVPDSFLLLRWRDVLTYARYGNPEPPRRLELPEAEWADLLTPLQFRVLRGGATEPAYRNAFCRSYAPGRYRCAGCGQLRAAAGSCGQLRAAAGSCGQLRAAAVRSRNQVPRHLRLAQLHPARHPERPAVSAR